MTDVKDRVYIEADIEAEFGDAYNQAKDEDDSKHYDTPFRYLTQWYLKDSKKADNVPLALPDSERFSQGREQHVICGLLVSRDGNDAPLSFELRQPVYWCVDRKKSKRGIWITSSTRTWYWLKQPHATQEAVHLPLRAKLGLLSNILDVFTEEHSGMAPEAVHELLSCNDGTINQRRETSSVPLCKTPWDMDLFWHALPFLKRQLKASLCTGWEKSTFWKALCKMSKTKESPETKIEWTPAKYLEKAENAEMRAQQLPWGEPLANWMMEARMNETAINLANSEQQLRKRAIPAGSSAKKQVKKQRLGLEDSAQDGKRKSRSSANLDGEEEDEGMLTPAENAKYTAQRMAQALKRLKAFLTPTPTSDERGEWDDIQSKFSLTDKKKASLLVALMRSDETFSEEFKLLALLSFENALAKGEPNVAKKLFNIKEVKVAEKTGARILEQWRQDAMATLEQLTPRHTTTGEWYSDVCAYKFVIAHIAFIKSCSVIKNKKQLDMLKEMYSLDWNQPGYLDDVKNFGWKHQMQTLVRKCVLAKTHLGNMMKKGEEQVPPVATMTAADANDATAIGDAASRQEEVQAGNEEEEKKRKQAKERKEKMIEDTKKKNAVTMTALRPVQQSAGQLPTLATGALVPSGHTQVIDRRVAKPAGPPAQQIDPKVLMWTTAKPLFLFPKDQYKAENEKMLRNIDDNPRPGEIPSFGQNGEHQSDTFRTGGRNKHSQEEIRSSRNPVVPAPVPSREHHRQIETLRSHEIEISSRGGTRKQNGEEEGQLTAGVSGGPFGRQLVPNDQFSRREHRRPSDDRGFENGYRPAAGYQHSNSQSRDYNRAPERIESRSRDNNRGFDHSIGPSLDYDRGSESSESRPRRGSEHKTEQSPEYDRRSQHSDNRSRDYNRGAEHRPRSNSQLEDRLDRRPAFGSMHKASGRGRGLDMTKPAWMTRREQSHEEREMPTQFRDGGMTTSAWTARGEQPEDSRQATAHKPSQNTW